MWDGPVFGEEAVRLLVSQVVICFPADDFLLLCCYWKWLKEASKATAGGELWLQSGGGRFR